MSVTGFRIVSPALTEILIVPDELKPGLETVMEAGPSGTSERV
jgi:hypothetical protein